MRAEQKIKDIEAKMLWSHNQGFMQFNHAELIAAGYVLKGTVSIILVFITMLNRGTPVLTFDDRFNLQPFEDLLSFPTGNKA